MAVIALVFASSVHAAELTLEQTPTELIITSSAPPTWRMVIAVNPKPTNAAPGGGTVRALHIPADAAESVVGTKPGEFCCSGWGLDNLEWRYVENNKGVRAPLGTTATIDSLEVVERSATRIVVSITGSWRNIPRFTRRIEIDPQGYRVRLEADWDGPVDRRGMWWLMSLFRDRWLDQSAMTISDPDTASVQLPIAKEKVASLPTGIGFPYEVAFPLQQGSARELRLTVNAFGTDQPVGLRYELWPAEKGLVMFYPRWVDRNFEKRRYVFDYAWRIGATPR